MKTFHIDYENFSYRREVKKGCVLDGLNAFNRLNISYFQY